MQVFCILACILALSTRLGVVAMSLTNSDANIVIVEPEFLKNYAISSHFATFTELPPFGKGFEGYVSIADPIDACGPLKNPPSMAKGTIMLVNRGNCEFYTKAMNVLRTGMSLEQLER